MKYVVLIFALLAGLAGLSFLQQQQVYSSHEDDTDLSYKERLFDLDSWLGTSRDCEDKLLAMKFDGHQACVTPLTFVKMYERDWLHPDWDYDGYIPELASAIRQNLKDSPQDLTEIEKEFLISEAKTDSRVTDLIQGKSYKASCCTRAADYDSPPPLYYLGVSFKLGEKGKYVTAEYDVQKGKITSVDTISRDSVGGIVELDSENAMVSENNLSMCAAERLEAGESCRDTIGKPEDTESPYMQQKKQGVAPEDVVCQHDLVFVQKYDGSSACVKPEIKHELYNRGWTLAGHLVVNHFRLDSPDNTDIKVNLSDKHVPRDGEGRIDYEKLAEIVSRPQFERILGERNVKFDAQEMMFFDGTSISMYTESGGACGYVIAEDGQDYWLQSSLHRETLRQANVLDENPQPCTPATQGSCFCKAQKHMTENTMEQLSFFDKQKEPEIAEIVFNYTITGNKNLTPKFKIGKYNLDYGKNRTGFCGEFWGNSMSDYFEGIIENGRVIDLGIEKTLSPLCAIRDDAKYHGEILADTR